MALGTWSRMPWFMPIWIFFLPTVMAASMDGTQNYAFPDIAFKAFNDFVTANFSSKVSLATVLMMLFSITENSDLLSLHGRQQKRIFKEEHATKTTAWINALSRGVKARIPGDPRKIFKKDNRPDSDDELITSLAVMLDGLAKALKLVPFDDNDEFTGKLQPVSHEQIQPVHVICPDAVVCLSAQCKPRSLIQSTKDRDIPRVTLIKQNKICHDVQVLTAKCPGCNTTYSADHERFANDNDQWKRIYLTSAQYLKVGQSTWVDRQFANGVINGMYSFHASAAAYTEYWNNSFGSLDFNFTRRQIWQSFVQGSLREISSDCQVDLELSDNLSIDEVTQEAFGLLGEQGIIRAAHGHSCSECTQNYKHNMDDIDHANVNVNVENDAELILVEHAPVKMIVMDGIVMGPTHCAYDNCTADLGNARGGAFCPHHEIQYGSQCRVRDCANVKVPATQACDEHQNHWKKYAESHSRQNLAGVRRILRGQNHNLPWQSRQERAIQPHDQEDPDADPPKTKNFFGPARFYCVETICAPCGVVIAWTKFARSESTTNILDWLESVYPTEEARPSYICIDKACMVLRRSITTGSWNTWKKTSRFIVDSYHYNNHRATDLLCQKWCNPAPRDGSAPNLVVLDQDQEGNPVYKRAFNTQACEQLNSWLGGYESILKRMTPGNFNWFIHAMLFHHTKQVLKKIDQKANKKRTDEDNGDEDDGNDE
jgi:hypothetical protein